MKQIVNFCLLLLINSAVYAQYPDLKVSITSKSPNPVAPGNYLTINYSVSNIGTGNSSIARVGFYLCSSTSIDASDIGLGNDYTSSGIPAGGSVSGSETFSIPSNIPLGTMYIIAYVDNNYSVSELNEANNSSGASSIKIGSSDVTPPAAPLNLQAIGGESKIMLDWDANTESDLASYSLYRNTVNSSSSAVLVSTIASSSYTDVNLTAGVLYYYWVKAKDNAGNSSAFSSVASASPIIDIVPPAVPTGLIAVAGSMKVSLSWTANSEPDLNAYMLYRNTTDLSSSAQLIATISSSSYTDFAVTGGTTYYYWVKAKDNSGNISSFSSIVSATPTIIIVTPPAGLTATEGIAKVTLNWAANSESNMNAYMIYRGTTNSSSSAQLIAINTSISLSYIDLDVTVGTTYYYWVKAKDNLNNVSQFSSVVSAAPLIDTPPAVPAGFNVKDSLSEAALSWTANSESDLKAYLLYRSTQNDLNTATLIKEIEKFKTSTEDNNVMVGTIYYYWLKAKDVNNNLSDFSVPVSVKIKKLDTVYLAAPKLIFRGYKGEPLFFTTSDDDVVNYLEVNLKWWGESKDGLLVHNLGYNENQEFSIKVSVPKKTYIPIGFNFRLANGSMAVFDYGNCGFKFGLGMRSNADQNMYVRVAAVDINGVKIDIKDGTAISTPYTGEQGWRFPSQVDYYGRSLYFNKDGYEAIWDDAAKCDKFANVPGTLPCARTTFDFARVKGFEIMVLGFNPETDDLNNVELVLKELTIEKQIAGLCALGLNDMPMKDNYKLNAYPNPISQSILHLNKTLEWAKIYNAQGNLVLVASHINEINIENLSAGLYLIESEMGSTRFIKK